MGETLKNLEKIYSHWESKVPANSAQSSLSINNDNTSYNQLMQNGKEKWKSKFANVSFQRRPRRNNNNIQRMALEDILVQSNLGNFKSAPSFDSSNFMFQRIINGRCCSCLPQSRASFYDDNLLKKQLCDVLAVKTKKSYCNYFTQSFAHIVWCSRRKTSFNYPDVTKKVLSSERVGEAIKKTTFLRAEENSSEKALKKCYIKNKKQASNILKMMKARISRPFIRIVGWILHKIFNRLLRSLVVPDAQLEILKRAHSKGLPLLYLPTHRSHLDYLLITFVLFNADLPAPHVAAGNNLLLPFFSSLMMWLGGFFVRRHLDLPDGSRDHIYRSVLHSYMEAIAIEGGCFEVFIEGGRTRSGKALRPKGGLLSVFVDSYLANLIPDAYIVPVAISYEKLLEGSFSSELLGKKKVSESFFHAVYYTWKAVFSNYGSIRIDFAQPISLKEFLRVAHDNTSHRKLSFSLSQTSPVVTPAVDASSSGVFDMSPTEERRIVQELADHVIYDCVRTQVFMSTQLLAFLFTTRFRQGVSFKHLIDSMEWLRQEITSESREVGFTGSTSDVVLYAQKLLTDELITRKKQVSQPSDSDGSDDLIWVPNLSLSRVFELTYYANSVTTFFARDSVMATALYGLLSMNQLEPGETRLKISHQYLISYTAILCDLFFYEYIFKSPCKSMDLALNESLERLMSADILVLEEVQETGPRRGWSKSLANELSWQDESDEEDQIASEKFYLFDPHCAYSTERLAFLCSVLAPLVETYYVVVSSVAALGESSISASRLRDDVHVTLLSRVHAGVAQYAESVSLDTVKNALLGLKHLQVLESVKGGGTDGEELVRITEEYRHEGTIYKLVSLLHDFRT